MMRPVPRRLCCCVCCRPLASCNEALETLRSDDPLKDAVLQSWNLLQGICEQAKASPVAHVGGSRSSSRVQAWWKVQWPHNLPQHTACACCHCESQAIQSQRARSQSAYPKQLGSLTGAAAQQRRLPTLHRGTVRAIMLQPHRSQISSRCILEVLNPTDPHLIRRRQLHAPARHQRRQRYCPAAAASQWQQAVDAASGKAYYW